MPNSIDVSSIWDAFLEEYVEDICCNETDYSYLCWDPAAASQHLQNLGLRPRLFR